MKITFGFIITVIVSPDNRKYEYLIILSEFIDFTLVFVLMQKIACVLQTTLIKPLCIKFHLEMEQIWANHSSVKCISYGTFEHETPTDFHFEVKEIQFTLGLRHMI